MVGRDRPRPVPAPLAGGARGAFTTRAGGVSPPPWDGLNLGGGVGDDPVRVAANRARLADWLGVPAVCFPRQVHGAAVRVVDAPEEPSPPGRSPVAGSGQPAPAEAAPGWDAVVTGRPGVAVGVLAADCVPILLHEPSAGLVAAVHAGRRGLVAGVVQATLAALAELGGRPDRLVAVVGPAVGGCCYEVPATMRAEVAAAVPGTAATTRDGRPSLDLPGGAGRLLRAGGVGRVRRVAACTVEDARFYSHRRDGRTGRFAGVVVLVAG